MYRPYTIRQGVATLAAAALFGACGGSITAPPERTPRVELPGTWVGRTADHELTLQFTPESSPSCVGCTNPYALAMLRVSGTYRDPHTDETFPINGLTQDQTGLLFDLFYRPQPNHLNASSYAYYGVVETSTRIRGELTFWVTTTTSRGTGTTPVSVPFTLERL